jgi:hypothetical protein
MFPVVAPLVVALLLYLLLQPAQEIQFIGKHLLRDKKQSTDLAHQK